MKKRYIEIVGFFLTVFFLIFAIIKNNLWNVRPFNLEKISPLLNTDGLSLLGCIFGLIFAILNKSYYIRKCLNYIFLNLNTSNLNYSLEVVFKTKDTIDTEKIKETFTDLLESYKKYKSSNYDVLNFGKNKINIFYKSMASYVEFKILEEEEGIIRWKISIKGTCNFKTIEKNVSFLVNCYLEKLIVEELKIDKIILSISEEDTEFSVVDKGLFEKIKNFKIIHPQITIKTSTSAQIILGKTGLSLYAKNKGDFIDAIEEFKYLLIS
ncbi:MAG: hypothetical protein ACRC0F_10455 [Cetobacterium sp.]